jgi:hypothetical protein
MEAICSSETLVTIYKTTRRQNPEYHNPRHLVFTSSGARGQVLHHTQQICIKTLMMEAASTSETSVNFYQTTRRNNPEDSHLYTRRRQISQMCINPKFDNYFTSNCVSMFLRFVLRLLYLLECRACQLYESMFGNCSVWNPAIFNWKESQIPY